MDLGRTEIVVRGPESQNSTFRYAIGQYSGKWEGGQFLLNPPSRPGGCRMPRAGVPPETNGRTA